MIHSFLAENIRIYRERSDLTQQQLADKVGVSWEMISRYERNESSALKNIEKISNALNVPKSQLLDRHTPGIYSHLECKIPLFIQLPLTKKFDPNQTNYYYVCPEWILKKYKECIAIDTSLIDSNDNQFQGNGVLFISTQVKPNVNDYILVKNNNLLITQRYNNKDTNLLGKILAQEVRY